MPNKTVTVVICSRNSERTLERTLDSCCKNNPLEIILVDQCSTDETLTIAERFGVRVLTHNRGLGYARQIGAIEARGELIAYVDSDVILSPNALDTLVEDMIKNGYAGISARTIAASRDTYWNWAEEQAGEMEYNREGEADLIGTAATIFTREVLLAYGFDPFFSGAAEDNDFAYRLRKAGHKLGVSSAIAYHDHPATLDQLMKKQYWYGKGDAMFFLKHRDLKYYILPFFAIPRAFFLCLEKNDFKMLPYYVFRSIPNILGRMVGFLGLPLMSRRNVKS